MREDLERRRNAPGSTRPGGVRQGQFLASKSINPYPHTMALGQWSSQHTTEFRKRRSVKQGGRRGRPVIVPGNRGDQADNSGGGGGSSGAAEKVALLPAFDSSNTTSSNSGSGCDQQGGHRGSIGLGEPSGSSMGLGSSGADYGGGRGPVLGASEPRLSRTQEMLTKIHSLIQEIRDIRQEKSNNIKTNLPEISQSCHKGNPALWDTSGEDDLHDAYSTDSIPTRYCQSYNNGKTPQCEALLSPSRSVPTPDPPSLPHMTPPTPSVPSGVSYVSSSPSLEVDKSDDMGEDVRNWSSVTRKGSSAGMSSELGVGGPEEVLVDPDPGKDSGTSLILASPNVY